ncbi:type VI secretion system baseplate subunit TssF [Acinetobacter sp. SwsAc6]|uniref:type VI secretion system baseplate subunit TssF n=1 Tax=Acinetobacter TaxID=469 RepID=UPI000D12B0C4|nr:MULTISPECIES: type VI secretion system baseplate subunit TssF [Acinetobacter]NWK75920.1 type VI secretion system baseplate subunit TssF [Acinetobacter sp. SwsAc6]QCO22110.1 type VI secretion system baseplate subunit TssF [Acinetobacter cumulans]RKG41291.1 type VI secretion system baseplate subunit TssF [Acinetobacter cumulans]RZG57151.1 type VI secretion system baseplate subunit TssF [Acinetobacter sp. WCHAc060006]
MIEELLPYYEKQLQEFAQQSRDFSNKYPKIAQRLSLNQEQIDDPHIERLIQAFSLVAARIDKKLDDSYEVFTRSIYEVMFPQYLKPFPASSVVSFEDINKIKTLTELHFIPRSTILKAKSVRGVQCEYATSYDTAIMPISLQNIHFKTHPTAQMHLNHNATLSFVFDIFNKSHRLLEQQHLPIYLDAISHFPLQVLDHIFRKGTHFSIKAGQESYDIANPFSLMGFDEADGILPLDQHTHHAYRLLMEYFCFPEKFNFLKLNLNAISHLALEHSSFELQIHFKLNLNDQASIRNYSELSTANFKLFATPIINLFKKQAEPQKINHKRMDYPLVTDAHHPDYFQAYSILKMNMVREKSAQDEVMHPILPFFAMSHYQHDQVKFFYSLKTSGLNNKSQEMSYSIISKSLDPASTKSDFISTELLCTNRDLPYESYNKDQNILTLNDSSLARRALMLKRPTQPFYFEQNKQEQWRIISQLSLNNMSLMKGDSVAHIKELLELYNLPKSKENQLIIDAIKEIDFSLAQKLVNSKPFPLFVRGVKVKISLDLEVFRGFSAYIFSQLLSHVFNLRVNLNSFVDVEIFDVHTQQEIYQCVQNVGGKMLL